ncbi:MAG: AzlC family ABC transporter permease [Actinomycetota bacterium]|nr:AzlC family ABC transporter permease [Actinomycetota bacterium]
MEHRDSFRRGLRLGLPFAAVGFFLSVSFGVLARQAGFSVAQASVTAMIVFAGSAQFAALSVVTAGGGIPAALTAGSLMNARFLAMGIALAPSLPGGPWRRAAQGQTVVDSSWALAHRGDGTFDRWLLFGTTVPQYAAWTLGSVVGAVSGDLLGDTERLGLDAIYPVFFLSLLIAELRDSTSRRVALAGALVALALVPLAPPGIPILAASAVALVGLVRRAG